MSILIFFIVLFVLILVHEWGHFITAKWTGMRVDEFGIGFPPKLFGYRRGETEYTFNALPIGGFVKIWGENYGTDDESEVVDRARAFGARPKWAQALVLIAGVTMNVILAWFLFTITFMIGVPTAVEESEASAAAELVVQEVIPGGPAEGLLLPGSSIVAVTANGQSLERLTPSQLSDFVATIGAAPITVTYETPAGTEDIIVTPVSGLLQDEPDRHLIGVRPVLVENRSYGLVDSIVNASHQTWNGLVLITVGLFSLIADTIVGTADYSQIAGPVGIVGMVGDAAAFGIVALLSFTAFISLNLAIINLLPFPALDGGRLVFVAIETITGRPIPPEWAGRLNLVGFALLMLLMIAVTYNDIARIIS